MGIKTISKNLIWKATNVNTRELRHIISHSRGIDQSNVINIDVNVRNIIHILSRKDNTYEKLVENTAKHLKQLVHETGFIVSAVLDGDSRSHGKRDSFDRRYNQVINLINGFYCRHAAMILVTDENQASEKKLKLKVLSSVKKTLGQQKIGD